MSTEPLIRQKFQKNKLPNALLSYSKWAKTIPISESTITLKFAIDNGRTITATQFEGGMVRIEKKGSWIGFTPYSQYRKVTIKVFKINQVRKQGKVVGKPSFAPKAKLGSLTKQCMLCDVWGSQVM